MRNTILPILLLFFAKITSVSTGTSIPQLPVKIHSANAPIELLSLNTWGLPVRLAGHDQKRRFENIPQVLAKAPAEIICLQECFSNRLRKDLQQNLRANYQTLSDYQCNRKILGLVKTDCYGGLMTFSKYPIVQETFFPFPRNGEMTMIEKWGTKGFLVSLLDLGDKKINIINTHLYAGNHPKAEAQRLLQIQYMNAVLDTLLVQQPYPSLLVGDLNITHPQVLEHNTKVSKSIVYDFIVNQMDFIDPTMQLDENDFTIDPLRNKYSGEKDGRQKLDYCLARKAPFSDSEIRIANSSTMFAGENAISDHLGLLSTLVFESAFTEETQAELLVK